MKKLRHLRISKLLLQFVTLILVSCGNEIRDRKIAKLATEDLVFNVGNIKKNDTHVFNFYVKSIGENPLIVDTVSTNCVCTNVRFLHTPIYKGDSIKFTVTYKANKQDSGKFTASFMVQANIQNYFVPVYFTGTLIDSL
jgi:hypothetical protein